jgi:hypothetical protein
MTTNENDNQSGIPDNSSSKPMDSRRDVEQSPDEKTDQDFPGYPHYPASEDIMSQQTGSHRVDADLESMGTGPNASGVNQRYLAGQEADRAQTNPIHRESTEDENAGLDGTNEEIGLPQNVANEDLMNDDNVPGTDIDEAAEKGSTNP